MVLTRERRKRKKKKGEIFGRRHPRSVTGKPAFSCYREGEKEKGKRR